MKVGNWIILAVLLGMLSATIWIAYDIWKTTADVPTSENDYIALGVGAALSLLVGCGLMALLFYRSRHPHRTNVARDPSFGQITVPRHGNNL
jgi:TRAP-type C4-dicarboxylate transport system permease small subunit